MRKIRAVASSVVGPIDANHWGQVLLTPNAYGVVEMEDSDGIARQRGVHVLTKLTRQVSREIVSLSDVRQTVESVWEVSARTVLLLVPVGTVIYLVLKGAGAVFLKRGNTLSNLLTEEGAISGEVQPGDTFLLASNGFTAALTREELAQSFDHLPPQEVSEKLTFLLHGKENGRGGAALILQVADIVSSEVWYGEEGEAEGKNMRRILARIRRFSLSAFKARMFHFRVRRPKLALVFASILILLFGISVAVGVRRQATQKKNKTAEEAVSQAQRLFDEGLALMELNPVMGRERLRQAKDILEPITATLPERSRQGKPVHDLYAQVVDNVTRALRVVRFEPELFYDVSLVKKDARGHAFGIAQESMGIIDQAGQTVYQLELATKNGQVMAGGDRFEGATAVAASAESLYVLADEGVHAVRRDDKQVLPQVIRPDSAWGEANAIVAYGGNLYLLDKGKSRIWKYVGAESGFSELREYLNPDTLPDFSQATSMAIDGSVWVATADGRVLRFTQGKEHTYTIEGVEPPLGKTLAVYTSDTDAYVYVSDTENQRVVVLDKDGIYISQYVWEGNFSPTGFAASEALKKLFFLADGKIYVTDLK